MLGFEPMNVGTSKQVFTSKENATFGNFGSANKTVERSSHRSSFKSSGNSVPKGFKDESPKEVKWNPINTHTGTVKRKESETDINIKPLVNVPAKSYNRNQSLTSEAKATCLKKNVGSDEDAGKNITSSSESNKGFVGDVVNHTAKSERDNDCFEILSASDSRSLKGEKMNSADEAKNKSSASKGSGVEAGGRVPEVMLEMVKNRDIGSSNSSKMLRQAEANKVNVAVLQKDVSTLRKGLKKHTGVSRARIDAKYSGQNMASVLKHISFNTDKDTKMQNSSTKNETTYNVAFVTKDINALNVEADEKAENQHESSEKIYGDAYSLEETISGDSVKTDNSEEIPLMNATRNETTSKDAYSTRGISSFVQARKNCKKNREQTFSFAKNEINMSFDTTYKTAFNKRQGIDANQNQRQIRAKPKRSLDGILSGIIKR